ncbi:copper homeostasis protein CutC [Singulisphaera sp. PoT]|uniref:copper homeostasis protein CutC n=1 Tax=Singulisphaera sp. PoT TaxID=3411797 RepID=UPI003BF4FA89
MSVAVEICVVGVPSAVAAAEGGADRVELCEYLEVGGVTPSAGAIQLACERLAIPVQVLIRPRPGDFVYSLIEMDVMARDIAIAKSLGAAAVVLGVLDSRGAIDVDRTAKLVELARPMSVTFHKAFDECKDPKAALESLCQIGVDRVLTSGQSPSAREGMDILRRLNEQAAGRLAVMAGGRIAEADIRPFIGAGLREIHIGSHVCDENRTSALKVRRLVELARLLGT